MTQLKLYALVRYKIDNKNVQCLKLMVKSHKAKHPYMYILVVLV